MTNVILVSLDTLRADRLGCYGYPRALSPNIDCVARQGTLFHNLLSPHIPTFPAHTTLFSGRDIFDHRVTNQSDANEPPGGIAMLAEVLQRQGFFTAAADNMGRWFAQGFELYRAYDWDTKATKEWRKGEAVTEAALEILNTAAAQPKPFFLFMHYWDPHTPYLPPAPFDRIFYEADEKNPANPSMEQLWSFKTFASYFAEWMPGVTDIEFPKAQYDAEVAYMDSCLAHLFTRIEELKLTENTLLVLTADHGEEMDEHGAWFDHHGLYDTNLRVPLIMRLAGKIPVGRQVGQQITLLDLAPTILDFLELDPPARKKMAGTSFVPVLTGAADSGAAAAPGIYISENTWMKKHGWRTANWKLICPLETPDVHGRSEPELYDLNADPREDRNLAQSMPEIVQQLTVAMSAHVEARLAATKQPHPLLTQPISHRSISSMKAAVPQDDAVIGHEVNASQQAPRGAEKPPVEAGLSGRAFVENSVEARKRSRAWRRRAARALKRLLRF
ncbi:MAG TPA: sulfatase [Chthonomonadales bacterium]|nr:sulfatase [Chthonomonadales bacterium]